MGVAIGRWPWLKMTRATIALVGATALIAIGVIPLEQAFRAIDWNTIVLLFAMMVLMALVTILCLGSVFYLAKDTQFLMPGPLTSAHGAIENCNACHTNYRNVAPVNPVGKRSGRNGEN